MNAAARLVHQEALSRHLVTVHLLSRKQLSMMLLAFMVLLSALSVIYVSHLTRELHAMYSENIAEQSRLHMQRGQLLLERGTWMMQARIQQIAEKKLGMVIPDHESTVVVSE